MALPKAIRLAIKTCLNKNILVNFLEEHGSEVENMLLTEWNLADAIEVAKEEEREELFAYLEKGHSLEEAKIAFRIDRKHRRLTRN